MPNTLHLIERVRQKVPRHTDYAVAKALEMDQSNLQRVLAGKAGLGPKAVIRLSELLQQDVRDLLVLVEEDKARTARDREFWERRSPRITAAIAVAILALGAAVTTTLRGPDTGYPSSVGLPLVYIMRILRKYLTFAKRLRFTMLGDVLAWARQPQSRLSLIAMA